VIELLHRAHEAPIALLDQLEQSEAATAVVPGDADDQAEVGFVQASFSPVAAGAHLVEEVGQLVLATGA